MDMSSARVSSTATPLYPEPHMLDLDRMAPARRINLPGPPKTLVLDNGAYTIKAGFSSSASSSTASSSDEPVPSVIPNCIARDRNKQLYIGSQLTTCKDYSEIMFRRPVEKGYLVNWEAEKEIWEYEFFDPKAKLYCNPKETGLVLTEAPNCLPALQANCDQVIFEEFGFARYLRCPAPQLNAFNDIPAIFKASKRDPNANFVPPAEILMLIDSGYSHTTITPLLVGRPIQAAVRRLDVGGKLLTNYLTRLLSIRNYDMTGETYAVNAMKEATCYITKDFKTELEKTWKGPRANRRATYEMSDGIAKDYVLPDYHTRSEGFIRPHDPNASTKLKELMTGRPLGATEDVVTLRNERFTVPELLFNPTDIGLRQSGIAQQVMHSLSSVPQGLWPGFLANIICVGGNAKIEGFIVRLQMEIRALAPAECIVRVARPPDPIISTWLGGANLARDEDRLKKLSVTKAEYDENGAGWVSRKFGGGLQ